MRTLVYDIETNGLLRRQLDAKGNVLPEMNTLWLVIIGDPATGEVVAYSDHDSDLPSLSQGYERLLGADRLVGHNVLNFDVPALERFGYPLDYTKNIDTMILSRLEEPSKQGGHSLAKWGEALNYPKGDFKDFGRYSKEMLEYALQDVRLNIEVWNKLQYLLEECPRAVEVEHVFGWCMSLQMRNGFSFDLDKAYELHAEFNAKVIEIENELGEIFPPIVHERYSEKTGKRLKDEVEVFNPGSRQQIANRLIAKYGWKPRSRTPSGAVKIDEKVLSGLRYPEAKVLVEYLTVQKKRSMLEGWLKAVDGGRIYGYINTIGANTHRCTHRDPNVAQVDKDARMRSCFKASEGMTLVGADAEGLELRMLGHYLARWDNGAFSKAVVEGTKEDGTDAHTLNQKAVGLHSRDSAKTFIYALIYGAGDAKLGSIIIEDAKKVGHPAPKGNVIQIGKAARARIEKNIVGLGKLVKACKSRMKQGWLTGLDGRKVHLRSEHSALNTLLQSAGAIVMKWAVYEFWMRNEKFYPDFVFRFCANVHDEQQFEVLESSGVPQMIGVEFCNAITKAGETLGVRCPLSGSYDIGPTWADTH